MPSGVTGLDRLRARLAELATKGGNAPTVVVGYSQRYALAVHENLNARHAEGKQAKYLEEPARREQAAIGQIVRDKARETGDLASALATAGLYLQRVSQEVVPIDTGALRASAFTSFEDGSIDSTVSFGGEVMKPAEQARAESEAIRIAEKRAVEKMAAKKGVSKTAYKKTLKTRREKARAALKAKVASRSKK